MASVNEIAFTINARLNRFNAAMQQGAANVARFENQIGMIGRQRAAVQNLIQLRQRVGENAREATAAQARVRALTTAIASSAAPTARMRSELTRAQEAARRAVTTFQQNRNALREMNTAMQATSVTTQQLHQRSAQLASQMTYLRTRQDAETASIRRQSAAYNELLARQKAAAAARAAITARAGAMQGRGGELMAGGAVLSGLAASYFGAVAAPVKTAIDYESAFADVKKVVDFREGTAEAQYMQEAITQMSKDVPIAQEKLAAMVATAAQSGIAKENLLDFTLQSAKMAVAFDVTPEQAAQSMNNWKNAMGLTLQETYELADSVNHLSNNTNTTAATTSNFIDRVGALGKMAGLTAQQTAAIGSSIMATGVAPEIAATGFKNFTLTLQKGAAATKAQIESFTKLGFSAENLAKRMQKDAQGAIFDVIKALRRLPKAERAATMSKLFGTESIAAITPLVEQFENYQKTLALVAKREKYLGSMEAEYVARSKTTENALQLMKNSFIALGTSIGTALLPSLAKIGGVIAPLLEKFATWVEKNQKLVVSLLEYGAILAGVAGVVGSFLMLVGSALMAAGAIYGLVAAISFVGVATVGIWAVAIAAIIAAGWWLYDNWADVCTAVKWTWNDICFGLATTWHAINDAIMNAWLFLFNYWENLANMYIAIWDMVKIAALIVINTMVSYWKWLFGIYAAIWEGIKNAAISAYSAILQKTQEVGNSIVSFFQNLNLFESGRKLIMTLADGIISAASAVYDAMKNVYEKAAKLMPHSDAQEGPFSQLTSSGRAIPETMAKGILQSGESLVSAFSDTAGGLFGSGNAISSITPVAGSASINVNFAPVINIGSAEGDTYAQVTNSLSTAREMLVEELTRLQNDRRRLSYA